MSMGLRQGALILGLCGLVALAGYINAPSGPSAKDLQAVDRWDLGTEPVAQPNVDMMRLGEIFEGPQLTAGTAGPQAVAAQWKVLAIVDEGESGYALIVVAGDEGSAPNRLHTGDRLPDGAKIVAIGPASFTIEEAEGQRTISIF